MIFFVCSFSELILIKIHTWGSTFIKSLFVLGNLLKHKDSKKKKIDYFFTAQNFIFHSNKTFPMHENMHVHNAILCHLVTWYLKRCNTVQICFYLFIYVFSFEEKKQMLMITTFESH